MAGAGIFFLMPNPAPKSSKIEDESLLTKIKAIDYLGVTTLVSPDN